MFIRNCRIALLLGLIRIVAQVQVQADEPPKSAGEESPAVLKDAERLAEQRERLGKRLTAMVEDAGLPSVQRGAAAKRLGELQYQPAIPVLILHLEIVNPQPFQFEPNLIADYPLTAALAKYGDAAVPLLVDACLAERFEDRLTLMRLAIQHGKTTETALRYLRGSEPPGKDDWRRKQNAETLKELLTEKR